MATIGSRFLGTAVVVAFAGLGVLAIGPGCSSDDTGNATDGAGASAASSSSTHQSSSSGGDGGNAPKAPSCADYCDEIMTNCTGDLAQYTSMDICMATCADMPVGKLSDVSGNTVGCREYHAGAPAKMDAATHCQHAGPSGAGVCGGLCDSFCAIALEACPDVFSGASDCKTTCAAFPDDMTSFSVNDAAGDSVQCRIYHVTAASVDPDLHCAHIANMPGTPCNPTP